MQIDLAQIEAIPDPVERVEAVREAMRETAQLRKDLAWITQRAVLQMRETMKLVEVADALGVSVGRVGQLEKPPGERHVEKDKTT